VSPAKMAEPIEMPFGLRTQVGPNPLLEGAILRGRGFLCKVYKRHCVICAKRAEPIKMPFGLWDRMGPRNHVR